MTEWWEDLAAGVAVLAVLGRWRFKRQKPPEYKRQLPEPPKHKCPGGRA